MANRKPKLQLPKSVLDMKFMKKSKLRIEKELKNVDHDCLYSNIITNGTSGAAGGNFISESSYIYCEELMEGRLSFKGMNPEIERLMELENQTLIPEEDMKKDISDEIMAKKMEGFNQRKRPYSSPSTVTIKKKRQ